MTCLNSGRLDGAKRPRRFRLTARNGKATSAPQGALDQQSETHEVTELLLAWRRGDCAAYNHLIEKVYRELRQSAERSLGKGFRSDLCPIPDEACDGDYELRAEAEALLRASVEAP